MYRFLLNASLAIAAALYPAAAPDQDKASSQAQSADDPIVVTGQRAIPRKEAARFVTRISTAVDGQLARFADPVCPTVFGLPDRYAGILTARVRQVAAAAHVPVDRQDCRPNLIIIIATDADQLVKQMRKDIRGLFGGLRESELKRALADGPVHVWNSVELRNEDGQTPTGGDDGGPPTLQVKSASIIDLSTQQAMVQSVIVIDDDAIVGKTLGQIADYVAMRTLAGTRPPGKGVPADTILTLFDPGAVAPPGLTAIDAAFLKGLYRTRPTGRSVMQRGQISNAIVRDARDRAKGEE